MIESIMYFGIGFLVATLLGLLFIPPVHNRAVRLTTKRLEASTPLSMIEIRVDKDRLRAEFAMSNRRLEMTIEELKAKTSMQFAELGKKTVTINQLKKELAEKKVTNFAASEDPSVAVCVLPGTELAFAHEVKRLPTRLWPWHDDGAIEYKTAIFRQINKDK